MRISSGPLARNPDGYRRGLLKNEAIGRSATRGRHPPVVRGSNWSAAGIRRAPLIPACPAGSSRS